MEDTIKLGIKTTTTAKLLKDTIIPSTVNKVATISFNKGDTMQHTANQATTKRIVSILVSLLTPRIHFYTHSPHLYLMLSRLFM